MDEQRTLAKLFGQPTGDCVVCAAPATRWVRVPAGPDHCARSPVPLSALPAVFGRPTLVQGARIARYHTAVIRSWRSFFARRSGASMSSTVGGALTLIPYLRRQPRRSAGLNPESHPYWPSPVRSADVRHDVWTGHVSQSALMVTICSRSSFRGRRRQSGRRYSFDAGPAASPLPEPVARQVASPSSRPLASGDGVGHALEHAHGDPCGRKIVSSSCVWKELRAVRNTMHTSSRTHIVGRAVVAPEVPLALARALHALAAGVSRRADTSGVEEPSAPPTPRRPL